MSDKPGLFARLRNWWRFWPRDWELRRLIKRQMWVTAFTLVVFGGIHLATNSLAIATFATVLLTMLGVACNSTALSAFVAAAFSTMSFMTFATPYLIAIIPVLVISVVVIAAAAAAEEVPWRHAALALLVQAGLIWVVLAGVSTVLHLLA